MTPRSSLSLLCSLAVLIAIGCTKDAPPNSDTAAVAAAPAAAAAPNVVTVNARDFAFEAPAEIPAGMTTFRLVNQGPDIHHIQLVRLAEGKTVDSLMAAFKAGGPPPAWAKDAGGPNAPTPGEESNYTTMLEPGNYAMICFIDTPDKVPHMMKGMVKPITVTSPPAGAVAAAEPAADVTMKLVDYAFELSKPLVAGRQTIRVENGATQPHEVFLIQFAPGKNMKDLMAWAKDYKGPPPGKAMGGVTAIPSNDHGTLTVDLPPGDYGLICFVPDAKDGKPHLAHGMTKEIKVT